MTTVKKNVNPNELHKFGSQAEQWWDPSGNFKTLHDINPLRMQFIEQAINLTGIKALDVGCGGGILTEALVKQGADALGIDLSPDLIDIAELHSLESGLASHYQLISVEEHAEQQAEQYDLVTCMEMLEHVPDPASIISSCAKLIKPGGKLVVSTLNREPKAYLLAIVAAEYLLNMLPKGTHNYHSFIKPAELCQLSRDAGLELQAFAGISYNPFSKVFSLGKDVSVNYLATFSKSL